MNAADEIARAQRWESTHRKLATVLGYLAVTAALLTAGWCSGRAHERQVTTAAHADSVRKVAQQGIARAAEAERADSAAVARASARVIQVHDSSIAAAYRDSLARARSTASRLAVTSDSTLTVHDTVATVPREVVVQMMNDAATIQADADLIAKQQAEIASLSAKVDTLTLQLTDTQNERDQRKIVATVDAAQLAVSQPKHRAGFKTGAVIGGLLVALIAHLAH
jgi:hypothetical protein